MSGSTYYRALTAEQRAALQAALSERTELEGRLQALGLRVACLDAQIAETEQKNRQLQSELAVLDTVLAKLELSRQQIVKAQDRQPQAKLLVADASGPGLEADGQDDRAGCPVEQLIAQALQRHQALLDDRPAIDLSDALEGGRIPPGTAEGFLTRGRQRLRQLVPLTDAQTQRLQALLSALEESANSGSDGLEALEYRFARQIEGLCKDLDEMQSAARHDAFLSYLALCGQLGEAPKQLDWLGLQHAIQDMIQRLVAKEQSVILLSNLNSILAQEGFNIVQASVLNGRSGRLFVRDDQACGLFVCEADGGFLFTTTTSTDIATASSSQRQEMLESVGSICALKGRVVDSLNSKSGIQLVQQYDLPEQLECTSYSDDFAAYREQQARQAAAGQGTAREPDRLHRQSEG